MRFYLNTNELFRAADDDNDDAAAANANVDDDDDDDDDDDGVGCCRGMILADWQNVGGNE